MMLDAAFTAAPAIPDMTRAATTAPSSFALPAQAPMMNTPRVDQALVMSQSVKPEQSNAHMSVKPEQPNAHMSTTQSTKPGMMHMQGGEQSHLQAKSQIVFKMCCKGTQDQNMSTKYSCVFKYFKNVPLMKNSCRGHDQHSPMHSSCSQQNVRLQRCAATSHGGRRVYGGLPAQ